MAISTFDGPVRSLGGFYAQGPNSIINIPNATNTITLTTAGYAGRLIKTNDATLVITLPAIIATAYSSSSGPGADPDSTNNIGTTDVAVTGTFTAAGGNPTAGAVVVTVEYIQRADDGSQAPTATQN